MATLDVRLSEVSFFKTTFVALALIFGSVDLAQANSPRKDEHKSSPLQSIFQKVAQASQKSSSTSIKKTESPTVQKVVSSHRSLNHYNKHYDDSYLRKWWDYYKKWGRKPSHVPPQIPPGYCPKDFEKKVTAVKVQGHHIYFNLNDLALLKSAGFILKDADLELVLKGRHKHDDNILVALNGLKASKSGQDKLNESIEYNKSYDISRTRFKLNYFILNGSEPFDRYLMRVKKQKGLLKLTLYGRHYHIVSASITFKGIAYNPCDNPGPGPGPGPQPNPPEDLTKYAAKIDSTDPSQSLTSSTSMLIHFSTINTDGNYWCSLDQAAFEKCQSPVSYAGLSNGVHNFQVFATTPKGVDGAKASHTWTVDNSRPVVSITNADQLPSITNQTSISFEFSSTKAGSTFRCSLDGATLHSCQSPHTYNVTTEGLHEFSVSAVDALGNVSGNAATYQWTLDLTAPVTTIVSITPADVISAVNSRNFAFAANETSDFECSLDQGSYSTCQSPMALNNLREGQHILSIRAKDMAGNQGSAVSYSWTNDYTAPQLSLGIVSPDQGLTNSKSVSVEFFSSEPAEITCQFNSEETTKCQSPFTRTNLDEGAHQLVIRAIDQAGLTAEAITLNWTVDSTAPMISFGEISPSAASFINRTELIAAVNASEELTLTASLDGVSLGVITSPIQLSGLAEGPHELAVMGQDAAGNSSNSIRHIFTVDVTAPQLTLVSEGSPLSNEDFRSFNFSANEKANFECNLDDAGFAPCQSQAFYSGLADGDHEFTLRVTDLAGNISTQSFNWSQDATAPITTQTHIQNGNSITFALSSNESNVSFECALDGVPVTPCNSSITYNGLLAGDHVFFARSTDAAGNVDPIGVTYSFTIAPPIKTIITSSTPPGDLVNSSTMTISFTADQPTLGFVCSLDGASFTPCVSAVTYSGLSDGPHTVTIKAIDQYGVMDPVGATKNWTVDTRGPVVSGLSATATTNSITVTWSTSEEATARVNYGVGNSLNQNTVETTTFSTSHSIQLVGLSSNTMYSIRVIGRDAAGNTYISNVITIRTNR